MLRLLILAFIAQSFGMMVFGQNLEKYATPWYNPLIAARTYCNPMNIGYTFEFDNNNSKIAPFRSTADPVIVPYKGEYYLFATNQSGFYWSKDLGDWTFVYSGFQRFPDDDDLCAPAVVVIGDTLFLMGSTYNRLPVWYTTDPKSGRWKHLVDSTYLPAWDPGLFLDEDKRLYLYYGSSGTLPDKGVELNKTTFGPLGDSTVYEQLVKTEDILEKQRAVGSIRELVGLVPELHGWERFGNNNDDPKAPWGNFIEGPWMTKHNGKYYFQYGAPGTEFKVYADGVYISDSPMGPFHYQKHNPFCYKPGGFVIGSGHGNTFQDNYGNYWHTGTCMISVKYKFERRIGMYPAGFDKDGILYANTAFGDYPTTLPFERADHTLGRFTGWMLLSYKKPALASSQDSIFNADLAFDEDIRTFWSARSNHPGEWLQVDLGCTKQIHAIQINYADHHANQRGKASDLYYQYQILASQDGKNWTLVVDKSYNDKDIPHDYVELNTPLLARYLKLVNLHMATGNFAISGFRVFGLGMGNKPQSVKDFKVTRSHQDPRNAILQWKSDPNAFGYNIYFGVDPLKLYNCITVYDTNTYDFRGMNRNDNYYYSIESFNENGVSGRTQTLEVK